MDDCPVLKARKKCPFQVSWSGSIESFQKHEKALLKALGNGEIVWRRHEKPLPAKIDIKFVPFAEDLVSQVDEVSFCESVAFVHVFFVTAASPEEYRLNVRHRVSDWFGQLNKAGNTHWLIIFDSTKAKEKKNRGSVIEKLKSDFAKHQDKLVEVFAESVVELNSKLLPFFLSSLDKFLANYEKAYAQLKGNYELDSWSLPTFVNQQFNLCRFYTNLGLWDCVLGELDKMDLLIGEIIASSSEHRPAWLQTLADQSFGANCPLLRLLMHVEGVATDVSLIELRTFILSNQLLSLFHIYNHRIAKTPPPSLDSSNETTSSADSMGTILANDFAMIVLRYSHACTQKINIEISELEIPHDPLLLHVWNVLLTTDVLELCEYLVDLSALTHGTGYACQLTSLRCSNLDSLVHARSSDAVAIWLRSTVGQRNADVLGRKTAETLNVLRRTFLPRDALEGSPDQGKSIEELYEAALQEAVERLRRYGWDKAADGFSRALFEHYREIDDTPKSKESYMALMTRLLENCKSIEVLRYYAGIGVNLFDPELQSDRSVLLDCLLVLALRDLDSEDDVSFATKFITEAAKPSPTPLTKYNFDFGLPISFPLKLHSVSDNFISILVNTPIQLTVNIDSAFAFDLPLSRVKAVFRKVSRYGLESMMPVFHCSMSIPDTGIASSRCHTTSKGFAARPDFEKSLKDALSELATSEESAPILSTSSPIVLKPGRNKISLSASAGDVGCFSLSHLELCVGDGFNFVMHHQTEMAETPLLDNVCCSIAVRKPTVNIRELSGTVKRSFIAGVVQKFTLDITAGTCPVPESSELHLKYTGEKNTMQFRSKSGEWMSSLTLTIPPLAPHSIESYDVYMCLPITEMNFSADDTHLIERQVKISWLEQTWLMQLKFKPIMSLKMSTVIIEQRVLFSVDVIRTDELDFVNLVLTGAELYQHQSIARPPMPAKLVNAHLNQIAAHSSHRIVWELPTSKIDKSIPLKHDVKLTYGLAKIADDTKAVIPSIAFDREYAFQWRQEFPIAMAEYDICAQIVAENNSLCRVDTECTLVVSLRLISTYVEPKVVTAVEADPAYWTIVDKFALVPMKESGVGQTSFTIIPRQIGLLPYPSVYIHQCNPDYNESDHRAPDVTALGERLNSYHRLQGKQVRVLAPRHSADDTQSGGAASTTGSIRLALKERSFQRLKKLIDRD
uniref:Foie-gras_1 domain-containing protein n=1 Tax=Panagrellus redivivus TaxID=6233 RepID=A0A7E4V0Q6_PANRE